MKPKILLVNPPIYDFTAYDFWLKPYGLLRTGGRLRQSNKVYLFDYLDRHHPAFDPNRQLRTDDWGRGPYPEQRIQKPPCFRDIRRYYRRFGMHRDVFQTYLASHGPFDAVLIQTMMTYWYPGVREVIDDIRQFCPQAKIALGGFYATACTAHAKSLDVDIVIAGDDLTPLKTLGLTVLDDSQPPCWELYPKLDVGILTLTHGCPFQCSYCFVPQSGIEFTVRPLDECLADLVRLISLGVENIAFYDDALLFEPERILIPFLQAVLDGRLSINFHTPNALHARFMTEELAQLMVQAGFKTFYLGFESRSQAFQLQTGAKVASDDLTFAVRNLLAAGADPHQITVYEMLGHPRADIQQLEPSMRFTNDLGIRIMLSDFSPIPGTPDGDLCRSIVDLSEPLNHNKTAFPIRYLGAKKVDFYKNLCKRLNNSI